MTCLMTVEDTLLGDDHLEAIGPSVDDRRADAPARALARNQQRIDALGREMCDERRPPEGARRALPQHDFPGCGATSSTISKRRRTFSANAGSEPERREGTNRPCSDQPSIPAPSSPVMWTIGIAAFLAASSSR